MTIKPWVAFIILITIVAIPLFAHLDSLPLDEWDEARLANNSLEMNYNHNWIVTKYNDAPDMWNTKPPLLIWLQVIMLKIFGISELAIRLPSALAALGTCLLFFFFFSKEYKEPWLGLIAVAVLVTSEGFLHLHAARSGDYDSLLTMLMTGYALSYFLYLDENKKKYIYATFIMLILAALTKGVQALMFLPVLLVYTIYKRRIFATLKQKEIYIGIVGFIFFVPGYYLLREHYNPGYITAVWQNELGGRYNTTIEGNGGDSFYYYDILNSQLNYWYLWIISGILCGLIGPRKWLKDISVYASLLVILYFIIITKAQTKTFWYLMPLYPFLAILAAIFIYTIFMALAEFYVTKQIRNNLLPFVFIFVIFTSKYATVTKNAFNAPHGFGYTGEIRDMELFLQNVLRGRKDINGYAIADAGYAQHLLWYYKALAYQHRPITAIEKKDLLPNSLVLAYNPETKKFIEGHYNVQKIDTFYAVTKYKLNERK